MTSLEFASLMRYVLELAPKTNLNDTQRALWERTLSQHPEAVVRCAIDAACAASAYESLRLGQITKVLADRRGDRGPGKDTTTERLAAEQEAASKARSSWETVAACINECSAEHLAIYKEQAIENHATPPMFKRVWPALDPRLDNPATRALRACISNLIRGRSCWPEAAELVGVDLDIARADALASAQRCDMIYGKHSRTTWLAHKRLAELRREEFAEPDPAEQVEPGNIGAAAVAATQGDNK